MSLIFVFSYIVLCILLGIWISKRVKNVSDFFVANHGLSLPLMIVVVFSSWFGASSVLGGPGKFFAGGLNAVIEDPFGVTLCLLLLALCFGKAMYKQSVLSIAEIYERSYGRGVSVLAAIVIIASYIGWIAGQSTALALVFNLLTHGMFSRHTYIIIAVLVLFFYTVFGGMWSLALIDMMQTFLIIAGLIYLCVMISLHYHVSVSHIVGAMYHEGRFNLLPKENAHDIFSYINSWLLMSLGLMPQQDVFQRVRSARSVSVVVKGCALAALLYLFFSFVPLYLVYATKIVSPDVVAQWLPVDPQMILPSFIMKDLPEYIQVVFFGAVVASLLSCGSAAFFAPSVTITESLIFPFLNNTPTPRQKLWISRCVLLLVGILVMLFAIWSNRSIYDTIVSSYEVILAAVFMPLWGALFWKKSTRWGAWVSMTLGFFVWLLTTLFCKEAVMPPTLLGFIVSALSFLVVSFYTHKPKPEPELVGKAQGHRIRMSVKRSLQ